MIFDKCYLPSIVRFQHGCSAFDIVDFSFEYYDRGIVHLLSNCGSCVIVLFISRYYALDIVCFIPGCCAVVAIVRRIPRARHLA